MKIMVIIVLAVLEELLRQLTSFNFVETIEESRSFNSPQKSHNPQNNILIPLTNKQLDIALDEDLSTFVFLEYLF